MLTPSQLAEIGEQDYHLLPMPTDMAAITMCTKSALLQHVEEQATRIRELERVRDAIPMYRFWFDTCTRTNAPKWEEHAALASEELDEALDAARKEPHV